MRETSHKMCWVREFHRPRITFGVQCTMLYSLKTEIHPSQYSHHTTSAHKTAQTSSVRPLSVAAAVARDALRVRRSSTLRCTAATAAKRRFSTCHHPDCLQTADLKRCSRKRARAASHITSAQRASLSQAAACAKSRLKPPLQQHIARKPVASNSSQRPKCSVQATSSREPARRPCRRWSAPFANVH